MSWLFGINKGQSKDIDLSSFQLPTAGGGGDDGKPKDGQGQAMEAYRFDSAAIERAAKAAKELERSRTFNTFDRRPHARDRSNGLILV